jgi:DNA-binding MarR family transcriptional regulator
MAKKVKVEDALCFNLYIATRLMNQAYAPLLEKLKLTYPQFLVMNLLWETNEVPVTTLSNRLYLDTGTISPLLKRLIILGYITKARSKLDERVVLVRLTKKGADLEKKTESIPMDMFCKLKVSMDRFAIIRDGVREIVHNLSH